MHRSLAFAALLLAAAPAAAERVVVSTEDGITVEQEDAPGRTLPVLTGTTTMAAPPEQVAAWIQATHTYTQWQHNCEEARQVTAADGSVYGYNRIGSPWPVSDRDVVLRSRRSDLPDGGIRLEFENTTTPEVPPVDGVVRMRRLVGSYALRPEGTGTHVVYTLDSDPGGSRPGWLVRQASTDLPYYTLRNLRERAEAGPPPAP